MSAGKPPSSISEVLANTSDQPKALAAKRTTQSLRVLILGDSLALCGFGKALDTRLRKLPQIESVSTVMACGAVPTTWLKTGALANARTGCGFWTIQGKTDGRPEEFQDTFGMEHGRRPQSHVVPKLENLLDELQPDILVMQNGTNLLSLFADGKTILASRHENQIRAYVTPFVSQLNEKARSLKKVYWVAPPVSGRVTTEIQDFLMQRLQAYASPFVQVIDSRTLIHAPYKNMMPDKEHFIGRDMDSWAEGVMKLLAQDISSGLLEKRQPSAALPIQAPTKSGNKDLGESHAKQQRKALVIRAKLLAKSKPLPLEKIAPYRESMVSHLYSVEKVMHGEYTEKEIVVMHPAHIAEKEQPLGKYVPGKKYFLDLVEFEGSPWESIKRSEETGRLELLPYIRKDDEAQFPSTIR